QDRRGEGWAIGTQRRKIRQMAKDRGWQIVAEYEDPSVSASKPRGAGTDWARMLRDADRGDFTHVVAVDVARLLRRTKDWTRPVRGSAQGRADHQIERAPTGRGYACPVRLDSVRVHEGRPADRGAG